MLNNKLLLGALVGTGFLAVSTLVLADNFTPGAYAGLQGGYADINLKHAAGSEFDYDHILSYKYDVDKDNGFAGRLFMGYDFTKYLGLEAGYAYLPKGKYTETERNGSNDKAEPIYKTISTTAKGYAIDVVGKLKAPIYENISLYAKFGVAYLHAKTETGDTERNFHNYNLVGGLGVNYNFTTNVAADLSWTRYNGNEKIYDDKYQPGIDFYAVGVSYKFTL